MVAVAVADCRFCRPVIDYSGGAILALRSGCWLTGMTLATRLRLIRPLVPTHRSESGINPVGVLRSPQTNFHQEHRHDL